MKKIYQIILNIFLFFVFIVILGNQVIAFGIDENKMTIKQLKNDIEVLKSKKVINNSIFEKFKQNNGELSNYFKKDLTIDDLKKIEEIIKNFNLDKKKVSDSTELLELKKKLYDSFLPFISEEKLSLFNEFIEKNISTVKKDNIIKKNIKKKEEIIEKKVLTIKEKIERNHKREEERLKIILRKKISDKIYAFTNSEKISLLSNEKKKKLFNVVLRRIQNIKNSKTKKFNEKQKYIINVIEDTLIDIINKIEE